MLKLLRDPFVQFLLAGAALYAVFALTAQENPDTLDRQITVDAPTLEWIYANFTKQFQRPPTPSEMSALVRTHIEHEVKYREALAIGLEDQDSIVQRRMVQKFDFLFGDAAAEMEPDDSTLQEWYEVHRNEYERPATISFTHHWFSPDVRNGRAEADAKSAAAILNAGEAVQSDPFPFEKNFDRDRESDIRRIFGQEFETALFAAPLNTWVGPLKSGLGFHAVRVTARTENVLPPLADVRDFVLDDWRRAESTQVLERTVTELMNHYEVSVDEAALQKLEYASEERSPE